jgi:uncharacterized OsmC-like protein
MSATQTQILNGIDSVAVKSLIQDVARDPRNGTAAFAVRTRWAGGTRSETTVDGYRFAGRWVDRPFTVATDEPFELGGTNTQPNPQEVLMAAFNACMMVGYVAGATLAGIELEHLELACEGELDLRGFLGLDPSVKPGYDAIHYTVRVKGNGTPEQFEAIHRTVIATSPNRFNLASPIRLTSNLIVE